MSDVYLPSRNADQWREFLAKPATQWKTGASAKAVAHCWQRAAGFPESVQHAFRACGREPFRSLKALLKLPEHRVSLPGGTQPSQNDVWVLARSERDLVSIAVEGKVNEPFDHPLSAWLVNASDGKRERLKFLCDELGLCGELPGSTKYQLLHRTASAILEAKRFNAAHAVMLVHSFSRTQIWIEDYQFFLALFGVSGGVNDVVSVGKRSGIDLHFAWVKGEECYLEI